MKSVFLIVCLITLSACTSIPLKKEATMVRLTHTEPSPERCQFLGDITGSQGDSFDGLFTTSENLETGARHDLKNKAHAMGGNVVYLLTQRAAQSGTFSNDGGVVEQTNVTLTGNVYKCPS